VCGVCVYFYWQSNNPEVRRHNSGLSADSLNSRDMRKRKEKGRQAERRRKLDAQSSDVDIGYIVDESETESGHDEFVVDKDSGPFPVLTSSTSILNGDLPPSFKDMRNYNSASLERSSSDQSTGSLLYCKTPTTGGGPSIHGSGGVSGMLGNSALGKSSSLIFPTGVDSVSADDRGRMESESAKLKRSQVNLRLDQCEAVRFPFKKKLMLNNMNLTAADISMKDLCGTALGNSLNKLSLSGNRLGFVPPKLVVSLPVLKTLDLSQCELHQLPEQFNLPKLTRLNLSHNRFTDFPDEVRNFWRSIGCGY
jgi:Leucine-rich repeat (LRR) protein